MPLSLIEVPERSIFIPLISCSLKYGQGQAQAHEPCGRISRKSTRRQAPPCEQRCSPEGGKARGDSQGKAGPTKPEYEHCSFLNQWGAAEKGCVIHSTYCHTSCGLDPCFIHLQSMTLIRMQPILSIAWWSPQIFGPWLVTLPFSRKNNVPLTKSMGFWRACKSTFHGPFSFLSPVLIQVAPRWAFISLYLEKANRQCGVQFPQEVNLRVFVWNRRLTEG